MSHFWSWKRVKRQCRKAYCKEKVAFYLIVYGRKTAAVCAKHVGEYEDDPHTEIMKKHTEVVKKQTMPQWSLF